MPVVAGCGHPRASPKGRAAARPREALTGRRNPGSAAGDGRVREERARIAMGES